MAELTDEQIEQEEAFLEGIPRINIGALFLPPIWGAAHGIWASVLWYPIWLFVDNMLYAAYSEGSVLSLVVALVAFVSLTAGTVAFALVGQPLAAHRAAERGMSKGAYLKRERIWAIVSVIIGCLMIAGASYYNIIIRPTLGM